MLLQLPDCLPGLLTGEDDRLAVRHPNVAQVKQEPGTAAQPAPQQDTQVSHASSILTCVQVGALIYTLQEDSFHWNLIFAFSLMANSLNLNSAYNYIFRNPLLIAYTIHIQKSKFANI